MLDRLAVVFRSEPVLAVGLVSALNGLIALFVPDEVTLAISAFNVALAAIVVRAIVTPIGKVAQTVTDAVTEAAQQAATQTAKTITAASAGDVEVVTEAGGVIADLAASDAVSNVLRSTGIVKAAHAA